ncbi:MAG TPA: hypothetical protein VFR43_11675 [Gaiellaceae bacterium]|nr:hypothetical protein [Gaiellaceae bacterium]
MGTKRHKSAETRIAIRSAITYNHNETLATRTGGAKTPRGIRNGLNLGNHNETLLAPRGLRNGMNLGNHNETLLAARTRTSGTKAPRGPRSGRYLNHNETLLAAARA